VKSRLQPVIFGEVLFDCFPNGEQVLGGAPFNVAWHLQAFGDQPQLISSVGDDAGGHNIIDAMQAWGMDITSLQVDPLHQTGRVAIELIDNEPHYTITPDCAYDFIEATTTNKINTDGILYHGSLALRNLTSRKAFENLATNPALSIFMDVNLRAPWYQLDELTHWLSQARWVKLNQHELAILGGATGNMSHDMTQFQETYNLDLLIITHGEAGASARTRSGEIHSVAPVAQQPVVDTVGAGDAFTAVFLHGLISNWPIPKILGSAQQFASAVVGLRGATTHDPSFYDAFKH